MTLQERGVAVANSQADLNAEAADKRPVGVRNNLTKL
jgi:hypothetical protein